MKMLWLLLLFCYPMNDNAYELEPTYLNPWIDCQDEYNKWYEAQIIAIQASNPKMIKAVISLEQYLRNFKPSKRDEQQFEDKLAVKGLQIVSMGEDGNCLFRSISHQVYGKEDFHMIIRQKCNDEIIIMTDNQQSQVDDDNDNAYELGSIYLNRWIDCQDEYNKWYEAQIIAIQPSNPKMIKVHYKGWKSKFDTWIDLNNEPERARLLHTFTDKPVKLGELSTFEIGTKCDCLDSTDKWYQAEIMEQNDNKELVRIHYKDWDEKYDEWINKDSYRIAPLHTMTSPTTTTNTKSGATPASKPKEPPKETPTASVERVSSPSHKSKRRGSGHNVSIKRKPKFKRNTSDNSNSSVRGGSGSVIRSGSYTIEDDHETTSQNITILSDDDSDYKNSMIEAPQSLVQPEIKDEDNDDDDDVNDENDNNTASTGDEAIIVSMKQHLKNFKALTRDEQQFEDKLAVKGLQIVSMGEDGNCLFRSISHQVYGKEDFHMIIRQKCVLKYWLIKDIHWNKQQ